MNNQEKMSNRAWHEVVEQLSAAPTSQVPDTLLHLARVIAGVPDPTYSCSQCETWLPEYVDDEVNGLDVAALYPNVKRHLDLCGECSAVYIAMLKWAQVEEAGQLPNVTPKRLPDTSFLPPLSFWAYVRAMGVRLIESSFLKTTEYMQIVNDFFELLELAGKNFVLTPSGALSDEHETEQLLVGTYATTQKLVQQWSASEIERHIKDGTLEESVRQQAQEVARQHGFFEQDAQRFAEQYAKLVSQAPQSLRQLVST